MGEIFGRREKPQVYERRARFGGANGDGDGEGGSVGDSFEGLGGENGDGDRERGSVGDALRPCLKRRIGKI